MEAKMRKFTVPLLLAALVIQTILIAIAVSSANDWRGIAVQLKKNSDSFEQSANELVKTTTACLLMLREANTK